MSLMIRQEERGKRENGKRAIKPSSRSLLRWRRIGVQTSLKLVKRLKTIWRWRWWWSRCCSCLSLISHFRLKLSLLAETLTGWALFQLVMRKVNNESWLKTQACGLDRSKRVGYDRLGMLSLTTWDSLGHSLMMEWLPSKCCLLKERAGYLAERVNKAERVQTLLQSTLLGSSRRIASAQLLSLRSETINGFLSN